MTGLTPLHLKAPPRELIRSFAAYPLAASRAATAQALAHLGRHSWDASLLEFIEPTQSACERRR